jgi:hypothetical protein
MGASESKLHFRKQIYELTEPLVIISNKNVQDDFWTAFFTLPESQEDVFLLCGQKELRLMIAQQPNNLKLFIQKVICVD